MTEDPKRFGSRLLAFAGLWLLLSGLLMALSFVDVVLVATAVLLIAGAAAGTIWFLRRVEFERKLGMGIVFAARAARRLSLRIRALGVGRRVTRLGAGGWKAATRAAHLAGQAVLGVWRRLRGLDVRRHLERLEARARKTAAAVPGLANRIVARGLRSYAIAVYWLQVRTLEALQRPPLVVESRQALRLNELGAQLRRRGDHEQAAERYRVALEIVRDLGDEQAEALTLNNLALALAQGGAEAEAVEHLEHALAVLRELGDEEHEAQVIANLGIVYRRQGHREEAASLLHEALDKLPPESSAYRQVEAELRRAS
jgi:tetratricopeptide (TPR) repeat protein